MRDLIKKILKEQLEGGENDNPLSKKTSKIIDYLNKVRHQIINLQSMLRLKFRLKGLILRVNGMLIEKMNGIML